MRVLQRLALLIGALSVTSCDVTTGVHLIPSSHNYSVGYGSLMQEKSRQRSVPFVKKSYPVVVHGFKRVWGMHGGHYKTTFLTVVKQKGAKLNAVYFPVNAQEMDALDQRESSYKRTLVPHERLSFYGLSYDVQGKYWIYVYPSNVQVKVPSINFPVVQSYVDIFLGGCFEIQRQYHLPGFVGECIRTTTDWPTAAGHWVNDRLYPRRPFDTPFASKIDGELAKVLKEDYYSHPFE